MLTYEGWKDDSGNIGGKTNSNSSILFLPVHLMCSHTHRKQQMALADLFIFISIRNHPAAC